MTATTTQTRYFQVTCVTTSNPYSHEGITHLGGDGWKKTRQQVIAEIESTTAHSVFYTKSGDNYAWVEVVNGRYGKYVQTRADGVLNNNLLYLPACRP